MNKSQQPAANDPLLGALLEARDEAERTRAIECLLEQARPVIATVLSRNRSGAFRRDDFGDVTSTVLMRLVRRLQLAASSPDAVITNFREYTASLAYNGVYEVLRTRFPQRTRIKNRLRYVLTHDDRFATWLVSHDSVTGLRSWQSRTDVVPAGATLPMGDAEPAMLAEDHTGDAIEAVLKRFARPLLLNDLTDILARLWGASEVQYDEGAEPVDATTPHDRLEIHEQLEHLWREVKELPPQQRAALLLNLRDVDGMNALALFVLLNVACVEEIAAALEMTTAHLKSIWNELPADDLTIGSILGKTRQQVINLRKSARDRLARRLKR